LPGYKDFQELALVCEGRQEEQEYELRIRKTKQHAKHSQNALAHFLNDPKI
jgi:hypothetical protein